RDCTRVLSALFLPRRCAGAGGGTDDAASRRQWRVLSHLRRGRESVTCPRPGRHRHRHTMIGCYDFCGHYEWTFAWLERTAGPGLLREYWTEAIARDSQRHARELIRHEGFDGMARYWQHTLTEESPSLGFHIARAPDRFR